MFSTDDTIIAIATPSGRGGIGVVRISGPDAHRVGGALAGVERFQPRHATLARVAHAGLHDQAIVTYFPAPASYTGEDVVEISAHGAPVILRALVAGGMASGARLAGPGEFTLRAYLHGRLDLVQAEAVADLIAAVTPLQARAAFDQLDGTLTARIGVVDEALFALTIRLEASLDFPEEGYHFVQPGETAAEIGAIAALIDALLLDARRGRLVREGARVAILGPPNAGKSTLFNALSGADRSIVTAIPGTTRDLVTELVDLGGTPVTLIDTAGLRIEPTDAVEAEGIGRARAAAAAADLIVVVIDQSAPLGGEAAAILSDTVKNRRLVVASKCDAAPAWQDPETIPVAALTGIGLDALREKILTALVERVVPADAPAVTNLRHVALLEQAQVALGRARDAALAHAPEEFVVADLIEARQSLEEITGRRSADDTLHAIFDKFCIGK